MSDLAIFQKKKHALEMTLTLEIVELFMLHLLGYFDFFNDPLESAKQDTNTAIRCEVLITLSRHATQKSSLCSSLFIFVIAWTIVTKI